jgi:hypothetical protein
MVGEKELKEREGEELGGLRRFKTFPQHGRERGGGGSSRTSRQTKETNKERKRKVGEIADYDNKKGWMNRSRQEGAHLPFPESAFRFVYDGNNVL